MAIAPDEEYRLWMLLNQVDTGMGKARENEVRPFGISAWQSGLMWILKAAREPCTLAEISQAMFREPHTVSEMVTRMQKRGLVKKTRSRTNKSQVTVTLTKKGEEVFEQQSQAREVIGRIFSCLSHKELENLGLYLEKLRARMLDELAVKPELPFP